METQLFYDLGKRGFFDSSGAATTLTELLKGCDRAQLCIAAGEFKDGKEFSPVDLSTYGVELGFTRPAACPQKGTWTATVGADTTDPLSAAPTAKALESHLNALPSVIAEGGLTVRVSNCNAGPSDTTSDCPQCADDGEVTKGPLCWDICWTTEGDKPDITLDTTPLWMDQVSSVTTQRQGDSNLTEVVQIKIREKAIAYSGTLEFTPKANSVISAADVKAGGAGSNAVQNVSISPAPIGGSFCIEIAGCQSEQISVFATADEFEDALKCSDDYRVVKTGDYSWDITYLGDTASHALLTIECDSVVSSQGVEGIFNLDTIPIKSLLNGCETVEGKIELVLTNNATGAVCRHSEDFEVCRGQIDLNQPGSEVPSTAPPLTIADNGNGTATTNTGICLKTCEAPDASLSHLTLNEPPRQLTDADIPNATDSEIGDTVSVTWADGTVELVTKQPDGTWTSSTVIEHPVTLTPTTGGTEVSYFDYVTGTQVTQLITGAISDFVFNVNPDGSVSIGHDGDGSGFDVFLIPAPPQGAISVITRTTNADGSVIHNHVDGNGVAYSWTTQPAADTQSESSDFAGSAAPVTYSRDQGTETEADFGPNAPNFGTAPATGESLRGGRMQQTAGLASEYITNFEKLTGNTIHVDAVTGQDSRNYTVNGKAFTASKYDEFRPYLTLEAAGSAAKEGDNIIVRSGLYTPLLALRPTARWHFNDGARVDYSAVNRPWIWEGAATQKTPLSVTGSGLFFIPTGNGAQKRVMLQRGEGDSFFEGDIDADQALGPQLHTLNGSADWTIGIFRGPHAGTIQTGTAGTGFRKSKLHVKNFFHRRPKSGNDQLIQVANLKDQQQAHVTVDNYEGSQTGSLFLTGFNTASNEEGSMITWDLGNLNEYDSEETLIAHRFKNEGDVVYNLNGNVRSSGFIGVMDNVDGIPSIGRVTINTASATYAYGASENFALSYGGVVLLEGGQHLNENSDVIKNSNAAASLFKRHYKDVVLVANTGDTINNTSFGPLDIQFQGVVEMNNPMNNVIGTPTVSHGTPIIDPNLETIHS